MIKHIFNLPFAEEWCDNCKRKCNEQERSPFLIISDNKDMHDMVLCKACMDLALNEQGILTEEF